MGGKRQADETSSDVGPVLSALIALLGHRNPPDQDDSLILAGRQCYLLTSRFGTVLQARGHVLSGSWPAAGRARRPV